MELRLLEQRADGVYQVMEERGPIFSSQGFVQLEDLGDYKTAKVKFRAGDGKVRTKPVVIQDLGQGIVQTYIRTADMRIR